MSELFDENVSGSKFIHDAFNRRLGGRGAEEARVYERRGRETAAWDRKDRYGYFSEIQLFLDQSLNLAACRLCLCMHVFQLLFVGGC